MLRSMKGLMPTHDRRCRGLTELDPASRPRDGSTRPESCRTELLLRGDPA